MTDRLLVLPDYRLGMVLSLHRHDDYSRFTLAWKLTKTMGADDVMETLEQTGIDQVHVQHRPRLLSDNGPCYLSGELKEYLGNEI